jgi:cation diffusion facilitator CzcD-associated flavoprotein CzcO
MAIDLLKRNSLQNFVILEKSSSIGGTWHDNKYPGCCCDVWSMLYSYSFEQNPDWTREYPGQEEILVRCSIQMRCCELETDVHCRTTSAVWRKSMACTSIYASTPQSKERPGTTPQIDGRWT